MMAGEFGGGMIAVIVGQRGEDEGVFFVFFLLLLSLTGPADVGIVVVVDIDAGRVVIVAVIIIVRNVLAIEAIQDDGGVPGKGAKSTYERIYRLVQIRRGTR